MKSVNFTHQSKANEQRFFLALFIAIGAVLILSSLIFIITKILLLSLFIFFVLLLLMYVSFKKRPSTLIKQMGAIPASESSYQRFHTIIEGLCLTHGITKPSLFVITSSELNGCAFGVDQQHANIVVTSHLLEELTPIELEGVLAQLLAHITTGVAKLHTLYYSQPMVKWLIPKHQASFLDMEAVRMTRYPPGLFHAYEKMIGSITPPSGATTRGNHIWVYWPAPQQRDTFDFSSLTARMDVLSEL